MIKKLFAVILVTGLVVSFAACEKKEEKPLLPPGHPSMGGGRPSGAEVANTPNTPKAERTVVVSKEVKARWKSVKLAVENKTTKMKKEHTVDIGSVLVVPNTKIKINVLAFLPDFKMGDKEITSASNDPKMPAVQVVIQEPGKPEWKGWLFSSVPDMHPFQHEKIGITLVGGVSK